MEVLCCDGEIDKYWCYCWDFLFCNVGDLVFVGGVVFVSMDEVVDVESGI